MQIGRMCGIMLLLKEDYITQSFGICRLQSLQLRFGTPIPGRFLRYLIKLQDTILKVPEY